MGPAVLDDSPFGIHHTGHRQSHPQDGALPLLLQDLSQNVLEELFERGTAALVDLPQGSEYSSGGVGDHGIVVVRLKIQSHDTAEITIDLKEDGGAAALGHQKLRGGFFPHQAGTHEPVHDVGHRGGTEPQDFRELDPGCFPPLSQGVEDEGGVGRPLKLAVPDYLH